ncbi:MAG: hypothetical protein Q9214_004646 [Letrouitia sp. 1 TL-2023]
MTADSRGDEEKEEEPPPSINVTSLSYAFPNGSTGLHNISFTLPPGSRTLLIGANGAGKTTLLRLLSGKRLSPPGTILVAGTDPFTTGLEGVTYLGTEWVLNPIVRTDIDVPTLLASVGGNHFRARRDALVALLDIDLRWRMHAVSDGERRRVQLAMGLLRPWRVLLLDEVTVDLDLLSRSRLLEFLRRETEARDAAIVYATHILDRLAAWPTHLVHMHMGRIKEWGSMAHFDGVDDELRRKSGNSQLGQLVLRWLEDDLRERGPRDGLPDDGQGKDRSDLQDGIGGYGMEKAPD